MRRKRRPSQRQRSLPITLRHRSGHRRISKPSSTLSTSPKLASTRTTILLPLFAATTQASSCLRAQKRIHQLCRAINPNQVQKRLRTTRAKIRSRPISWTRQLRSRHGRASTARSAAWTWIKSSRIGLWRVSRRCSPTLLASCQPSMLACPASRARIGLVGATITCTMRLPCRRLRLVYLASTHINLRRIRCTMPVRCHSQPLDLVDPARSL